MKYAVISDIHGNLEALKTVLSDAEAQRVDGYILLGDYCLSNPEPDACVTRIRNLPNAHVIRGNEERYGSGGFASIIAAWEKSQFP